MFKHERKLTEGELDLPLNWNSPFSELFPLLSLPMDLEQIKRVVVPVDFLATDDVIMPGFERKFVYFLLQQLSPNLTSSEDQQAEITRIRQVLLSEKFSLARSNVRPGFNVIKNEAFFRVYQKLGLDSQLDKLFAREARSFLLLKNALQLRLGKNVGEYNVEDLIAMGLAVSPSEVVEIVQSGPLVSHLSDALDAEGQTEAVGDKQVRDFVTNNYPPELIATKIKIGRITGSSNMLFLDPKTWTTKELTEADYQVLIEEVGAVEAYKRTVLSFVTTYEGWIGIQLYNLCQNIPEMAEKMLVSLDYLPANWAGGVKRIAYALGLIVHEFLHRLQTDEVMADYAVVAKETWDKSDSTWHGYVTEYVYMYVSEYGGSERQILREDLADSVQIYVINAGYLKEHYPKRYDFIAQRFPHLVPNSAQQLALATLS